MIFLGLLILGAGLAFWVGGEEGGRTVFFIGVGYTWASSGL